MDSYYCLKAKVTATNLNEVCSFFLENINLSKGNYICCANAHTTVTAYENNNYLRIFNNSYIVLPDGGPIVNFGKKNGYNVEKVSGVDFFETIIRETSNNENIKHFFYGNTKENLELLIKYLNINYPKLNVVGYEPSKFRDLCEIEKLDLKKRINKSHANLVWVALGAPRQELFCAEMCNETNACWIAVGGAFNVVAGIIPRAPKWMQDHSLEWLYRFIKEPKRLFKRYFIGNAKYIWYNIIYKWKKEN